MADPHAAPPAASRSGLDGMFDTLRGFGVRRNTDERWLAGVCSGVADRLGIDPLIVRGALFVLLFVGGLGGLVYLIAWALLPDQNGKILAEAALHGDGWGIALLIVIGIALISNVADRWWLWTILVPVGLLGWWALHSARQGKTPEQMGDEAREFGNKFAATFSRPAVATPNDVAPASETESPMSAATSTTPAASPVHAPPPYGMGPGRTGVLAAPDRVVHRPRRRGGFLGLLLTAGLAVAGYGLGQWYAQRSGFAGSPAVLAAGFAVAGAGLALLVIGLTGRRAGFTTFLVTLAALATVGATSLPAMPSGGFGERQWSAASQPADGFSLTAGEAQLGLAGAAPGSTIRVAMGAGQLKISVPKGTTVTFVPTVKAGQVVVHRAGATGKEVQGGVDSANGQPITVGTGPTPLTVDVDMVAGELVITEES
ncbi:MAG TPA: PspC domain-containing protein [Lapillicoccus sp.]|uniref:PspC domain-containing protein n=1 Tax=Lapillicoccus sp. TaxID=1909287 RepID=UPI002F9418AB